MTCSAVSISTPLGILSLRYATAPVITSEAALMQSYDKLIVSAHIVSTWNFKPIDGRNAAGL